MRKTGGRLWGTVHADRCVFQLPRPFGYRVTNQTTVEAAYTHQPRQCRQPAYGLNVALVLPRAHERPSWRRTGRRASRPSPSTTARTRCGRPSARTSSSSISSKQQVKDLGLTVIESTDISLGSYVTSAESLDHLGAGQTRPATCASCFSDQTDLRQWTNPQDTNDNFLFWNGQLSLPTPWKVSGLWFRTSAKALRIVESRAGCRRSHLAQGPQGSAMPRPSSPPLRRRPSPRATISR
jgi:hypothetical protein